MTLLTILKSAARTASLGALALATMGTAGTLAQETAAPAEAAASAINSGDTAWMLVSTILVLFMILPGLALFYGGLVRAKNVLSLLMQCTMITAAVIIVWVVWGYSFAFGGGTSPYWGGFGKVFLAGVTPDSESGSIPELVFIAFQMTFACITPALIVGGFAERIKFGAVILFVVLWVTFVYFPIAHMAWDANGLFFGWGTMDFAGGTVVHINAGIAALVGAIMVGKRLGYGKDNMAPHSMPLTLIGAAILWVGWFGFNAGSALTAGYRAGMALAATHIATAAAALGWLFAEWLAKGKPSVLGVISGAVAGLVAVTPAAGFVDPTGALIIGAIAGVVCFWAATSLKRALGYDDSLDAFGVHGVGGLIGAILTGVFAKMSVSNSEGAFAAVLAKDPAATLGALEGNIAQVWLQVEGVLYTVGFTAVATFILLKLVDVVMGLRVEEEVERDGLDLALHGETIH